MVLSLVLTLLAAFDTTPKADVTFSLEGWKLLKGTTRAYVIGSCPSRFELMPVNGSTDSGVLLVREKTQPGHIAGTLTFEDGRLSSVSHILVLTGEDDSVDLASRMLELLDRLAKEYGTKPEVSSRTIVQPGVTVRQTQLLFGSRRLLLYVLDRTNGNGTHSREAHLEEVLE